MDIKYACGSAVLSFFFWPVTGPIFWAMRTTLYERQQKIIEQQKELDERFRQLQKDVMQFGQKNIEEM